MRGAAPPTTLLGLALVVAALAAAVLVLASDEEPGDGRPGSRIRTAERFEFEYPRNWQKIEGLRYDNAEAAGDEDIGENTFGLDQDNWVGVSFIARNPQPVVAGNIDQAVAYTRRQTGRFARSIEGGEILRESSVTTAAGLPALETRLAYKAATGATVESRVFGINDRRDLYAVTCQRERDAPPEVRSAVERGCDLVLETFTPRG